MKFEKFISRFNFITNILILLILLFGGVIWADSNGIWHRAEDIVEGTFGGDENNSMYIFPNDMEVKNDFCLGNECHKNWSTICQSWVESNSLN